MKYKCLICGQIFDVKDGEEPICPVCKARGEKVVPYVEEELSWPAEHHVGIAQGVDPEILEGLRNNFNGECSEVGMYLAMARQALREGYPEVAVVLEQIAHEEAEHAARFQEMLGDLVTPSTKEITFPATVKDDKVLSLDALTNTFVLISLSNIY